MRIKELLLIFLLVVGVVYLWHNWYSTGTSDQGIKLTATPVKSIVYDNYPWLTGTEVVRVIYSYPRNLVNTTYFFVELEIPEGVISYLSSLLSGKYADITPKDSLIAPVIFAAKDSYGRFDYARIFNYNVVENTTDGIPKKILVTLYANDVPQDYNLIIVEFLRPYHETFLGIPHTTQITNVGQIVRDFVVERVDGGMSIFIDSDEIWSTAIKIETEEWRTDHVLLLSREAYIPIYSNDSLFIKADYREYGGSGRRGVVIGLLLVMKDGSKRIISFEGGTAYPDYYSGVYGVSGIPICKIRDVNLREFQSVRAFIERDCSINWNDIAYVSRIYVGLSVRWWAYESIGIALRNFFVGYLT